MTRTRTWSIADIADALEDGLRRSIDDLEREQAVHGLDTRDEVELHPMLADALEQADFGVAREQRYPADRRKRNESEGERCDLVLTHGGRPLRTDERHATLFDSPDAVALDDAFWLEVKCVAQHTIEGPNASYSSQLLSTVRHDVTKLSKDPGILHAGLLIVLFVQHPRVAEHDLAIWQDRCLARGLPIGAPCVRVVEMNDRIGNGCAVAAVYPVMHY